LKIRKRYISGFDERVETGWESREKISRFFWNGKYEVLTLASQNT
jgi:hypothetical protein